MMKLFKRNNTLQMAILEAIEIKLIASINCIELSLEDLPKEKRDSISFWLEKIKECSTSLKEQCIELQ